MLLFDLNQYEAYNHLFGDEVSWKKTCDEVLEQIKEGIS